MQPRYEGRMRLPPRYKHTSGAVIQLTGDGWFFCCTTASGDALNSLWRTGDGRLFESAIDAMKAAESAMTKESTYGR